LKFLPPRNSLNGEKAKKKFLVLRKKPLKWVRKNLGNWGFSVKWENPFFFWGFPLFSQKSLREEGNKFLGEKFK